MYNNNFNYKKNYETKKLIISKRKKRQFNYCFYNIITTTSTFTRLSVIKTER